MLYLPDLKPFAKLHILENLFLLTCWWFPFPMVKELDNYKCWEMVKPPFSSHAFIPFTAGRLLTIYFCFFPSVFFFHTCTLANSSALSWIYSDLVTRKYGNNDNKGARGESKQANISLYTVCKYKQYLNFLFFIFTIIIYFLVVEFQLLVICMC